MPVGQTDDEKTSSTEPVIIDSTLEGLLAPKSDVTIAFKFAPAAVGPTQKAYEITFLDQPVPPILIRVVGECSDLPVQLEQAIVDFQTCQHGRAYAESLAIRNNGTSAAQLQFELPKAAEQFFEISPKTAFVQASVCLLHRCLIRYSSLSFGCFFLVGFGFSSPT